MPTTLRRHVPRALIARSPDRRAMLVLLGAVFAANAISILRITDPNPLGVLIGLGTVKLGPVAGHGTLDPNIGYTGQALGHRAMLELVHGHLPWWNPYEGTGMPLAGEMQSGAFFPPNLLLLMSNGQLWMRMLLEMVAGGSTYFLLRRLELSSTAALAAGVAFALNGAFAWLQNTVINPVPFLPLALLALERARAAAISGRPGGWRLLALAGALSFAAGFPETTYIDTLMVIAWFLWRACGRELDRAQRRAFVGKCVAGGVTAALLAAPLMIAFVDLLRHANLGANGGDFNSQHLPAQGIAQLLMPYFYGPLLRFGDAGGVLQTQWGVGGYVTLALFLLGLCGLCARRLGGLRITLSIVILLMFAKAYGQIPLLGHVLSVLPGMKHTIFYRYATPSIELSLFVLAALGADEIVRAPRRAVVAGGAIVSLVVLAVLWKTTGGFRREIAAGYADRNYAEASAAWAAGTVLVLAGAALLLRSGRWRGIVIVAVIAIEAAIMFAVPELSSVRSVKVDEAPIHFLKANLGAGRFATTGPIQPDYGSYYALSGININDGALPQNLADFVSRKLNPAETGALFTGTFGGAPGTPGSAIGELLAHLPAYRAAAVKYVLVPADQPVENTALELAARTPTTLIYKLRGAQPLIAAHGPGCRVSTTSLTTATADCSAPGQVIYHETAASGWSASVDGHDVSDRTSDGIFQVIDVPAGHHRISFRYRPPGVLWGEAGFVVGVLALLLAELRRRGISVTESLRRPARATGAAPGPS